MSRDTYQPTEEQEQAAVFAWAQTMAGRFPELLLLFHIPNGGLRSITEAVRFKKAGVKPGVPDLFLPVARGRSHGLFVEMKRRKGGRVSKEQEAWIDAVGQQGYMCVVAHGAEAACCYIQEYLEDNPLWG